MVILSIVTGLSLFMFHQSAGFFQESDSTSHLVERAQYGVNAARKDLRETDSDKITVYSFTDADFSEDQDALALATARDVNGDFQVDSRYEADWQGVIVFCPYKQSGTIGELRRYVSYGSYTFPCTFDSITSDTISITEQSGGIQISIDRGSGAVSTTPPGQGTAGDPPYQVVASMVSLASISSAAAIYEVTLNAEASGRTGGILSRELKAYVYPRN